MGEKGLHAFHGRWLYQLVVLIIIQLLTGSCKAQYEAVALIGSACSAL